MSGREILLALAERCEQATGRDWALDADIAEGMNPEFQSTPWERIDYPGGRWVVFADRSAPDNWNIVSPPPYTSFIDVALTLVPEGWKWALHSADDAGPPCAFCVSDMGKLPWSKRVDDTHAATPALALCAAALRARAAEVRDGE